MKGLSVRVNNRNGFSEAQAKNYDEACAKLVEVVNSVEFRTAIITTLFTSTPKNSLEVYESIMNGAEILTPEIDHEIDISVELYYKNNSVVGWTNPSIIWTYINDKFFKTYDQAAIAGNIFHEWLHKLGYDHKSASEKTSVPYKVGYMVRDLIRELDSGRVFTPLLEDYTHDLPEPTPLPIEQKKYVCRWTWRFWRGKVCRYE